MHRRGIFHRDIKPENILVNHNCDFDKGLKLADFGSCRGIYSKQPYTEYISTRWYRAPECLLTDGYYGPEMDLWGVGCVFFEITSLYPLFPGTNELDQINRVHQILGTPPDETMQKFKRKGAAHLDFNYPSVKGTGISKLIPHAPPEAVDLMQKLLAYDPDDRISAKEALKASYFSDLHKMEANLKRRSRGNSSRTSPSHKDTGGNVSPDLERSGNSKLKSDRSNQSLGMKEKSKEKSKDPPPPSNKSKSGNSLPSISNTGGAGRLAELNNRSDNNNDSPLPPIVSGSKDKNDDSSNSKVTQSHSTSNLSSKTYGNSSYTRRQQKEKSLL
jgi:serine/threonine protein kinase